MADTQFKFSQDEVRRLSGLTQAQWLNERKRVVQEKPPFDLEGRERALRELYEVLEGMGVIYWLSSGSVLGAVRENDFIPWDDDFDMTMRDTEFRHVSYELKRKLVKAGFVVRLTNRKQLPKMAVFKYGQKFALSSHHNNGEYCWQAQEKFLAKHFRAKATINFKGMTFRVPYPMEEYLTYMYGNWCKPIKSYEFAEYMTVKHLRGLTPIAYVKALYYKMKNRRIPEVKPKGIKVTIHE